MSGRFERFFFGIAAAYVLGVIGLIVYVGMKKPVLVVLPLGGIVSLIVSVYLLGYGVERLLEQLQTKSDTSDAE